MPELSPAIEPPRKGRPRGRLWGGLAIAALALAALTATLTYEQDFDAHWHLAAGKWMLQHQRVLDHDPYTSDPEDTSYDAGPEGRCAPWVNVYWLFQIVLAVLHSLGGWGALTVLQAVLTAGAFLIFALSLRKEVPAAWIVLAGLVVLPLFASRIRMRPEMFTLPFLMAVVVQMDRVRRGAEARKLWWLVPILLTWVNMHGLYILGLAVAWGGLVGAALEKKLGRGALAGNLPTQAALAPVLAATVVCLITPWPLEAALHPLRLWSRISGEASYFTFGVSEFRPTWQFLAEQKPMLVLAGLTILVLVLNYRKVPLVHLIWLVPFLALALLAVRNVALLAPVCAVPLAWHGGCLFRRLGDWRPGLRRSAPVAAALLTLAGLALAAANLTEYTYRSLRTNTRTGLGLCPHYYQEGLARYLAELKAPGDVFSVDFGSASAYIYYTYPHRKVWMDGRLEIRSLTRFQRYFDIARELRSPGGADRQPMPRTVRFVTVPRDGDEHLAALNQSNKFRLIHLDPTGAIFAWNDWHDGRPPLELARELPARPNFADYDRPLSREGQVEGTPIHRFRWWRRNENSPSFLLGRMLLALGSAGETPLARPASALQQRCTLLATRYLTASTGENVLRPSVPPAILAEALRQWSRQTSGDAGGETIPVDVDLARASWLLWRLDPGEDPDKNGKTAGFRLVQCLVQGEQWDAATEKVEAMANYLSRFEKVHHPPDYDRVRNILRGKMEEVQAGIVGVDLQRMPPLERARFLAARPRGLTQEAIRQLRATPALDPNERVFLGDLLLRLGRSEEARQEYEAAAARGAPGPVVALRRALCDWVEGNLYAALDKLEDRSANPYAPEAPSGASPLPLALYYRALLMEQLGHYGPATDALRLASADADPDLSKLIETARARIQSYAD